MKKKLNIQKLKVSSFVSNTQADITNEKGGGGTSRGMTVENGCTMYPVCTGCGCGLPEPV